MSTLWKMLVCNNYNFGFALPMLALPFSILDRWLNLVVQFVFQIVAKSNLEGCMCVCVLLGFPAPLLGILDL